MGGDGRLEPTAALRAFTSSGAICVSHRSWVSVWNISSLLPVGGLSETQNTEERQSFPPKLWFRQQPLGATVASASNDKWVRAGVGDRRSLVPGPG